MSERSELEGKARSLVADALVWDAIVSWTSMDLMSASKASKARVFSDYLAAGVNVIDLTISGDYGSAFDRERGWIASERRYIRETHADTCVLVTTVDDLARAQGEGKLAILFHFQGGTPFLHFNSEAAGSVDLVQFYYDVGVRRALLSLNYRSAIADGCYEPGNAGISAFGVRLIEEMNRVGMVIDCTHMGIRSTLDAMASSTKPVVFSHSNARARFDHPRNITDEQIRACAATGGVIGIAGWGPIVNAQNDVSAPAIAEHIFHVIDLVGVEHVGIGLDFVYEPALTTLRVKQNPDIYAPVGGTLEDWNFHHELQAFAPPTVFQELTEVMMARGLSETDIRGVLGENWLRVAKANWANPA